MRKDHKLALSEMVLQQLRDWAYAIYYFLCSLVTPRLQVTFPKSQIQVTVVGKKNQSIGEGAFSTVFQAVDREHPKKQYALKRMLLQSLDLANMAHNEVAAYQRFTHANIIQLVDQVERIEDNQPVIYMLLPFCSRGSLRDELNLMLTEAIKKPPAIQVLKRFANICEAVQVLHNFVPSYVHFDIKPEVSAPLCFALTV